MSLLPSSSIQCLKGVWTVIRDSTQVLIFDSLPLLRPVPYRVCLRTSRSPTRVPGPESGGPMFPGSSLTCVGVDHTVSLDRRRGSSTFFHLGVTELITTRRMELNKYLIDEGRIIRHSWNVGSIIRHQGPKVREDRSPLCRTGCTDPRHTSLPDTVSWESPLVRSLRCLVFTVTQSL